MQGAASGHRRLAARRQRDGAPCAGRRQGQGGLAQFRSCYGVGGSGGERVAAVAAARGRLVAAAATNCHAAYPFLTTWQHSPAIWISSRARRGAAVLHLPRATTIVCETATSCAVRQKEPQGAVTSAINRAWANCATRREYCVAMYCCGVGAQPHSPLHCCIAYTALVYTIACFRHRCQPVQRCMSS